MRCKVSGVKIKPFMSFGRMPMANGFLSKKNFKKEFFYKLQVGFNRGNYLFQVDNHPKSPSIFNNQYPFYTNKSLFMTKHFKKYFIWAKKNYLKPKSRIIEIGSNDGTLLHNFKKNNFIHLGIEPSKNVADFSKRRGLKVLNKFFSYKEVRKLIKFKKKTDLICAANVICHIPNLNDVIKAVDSLLTKNGVFVFEEPYLGSMFKKTSYDQIYDAHIFMFSVHSVRSIFKDKGFDLIDAIPQKSHGGSMRYIIARKGAKKIKNSIKILIKREVSEKLNKISSCFRFKRNCIKSRNNFRKKIIKLKEEGKSICGYSASAKSTTALNFCKIDSKYIDFIADSTKEKIGKFTPGTHIPVVSIDYFRNNYTNVAILCSWNHKKEIQQKEGGFKKAGGKWIAHVK